MSDRSPVRLGVIHTLDEVLTRAGVSPHVVLARAGISERRWQNHSALIVRAQLYTALDQAARMAGDPLIAIRMAGITDPRHLGLVGSELFRGYTLEGCLRSLIRFMPSLQTNAYLQLYMRNGVAIWTQELRGSSFEAAALYYEGSAAFMATAITRISAQQGKPHLITFPHRARAPLHFYEDLFGCEVRFSVGMQCSIHFPAAALTVVRAGAARRRQNVPMQVQDPASTPASPDGFELADEDLIEAVEALIDGMMSSGSISMAGGASTLGMAPRTLQRRLAAMHTSFDELVEARRRQRAIELLGTSQFSVTQVAMALAYSDSPHFIRAFHRWNGMSPGDFMAIASRSGAPPRGMSFGDVK